MAGYPKEQKKSGPPYVEVKDGCHPSYVIDEKARFKVLDPSPVMGIAGWAILDQELTAVIAFTPAREQAFRIVSALNEKYAVKGGK